MRDFLPREHWNEQQGRKRTAKRGFRSRREACRFIESKGLTATLHAYKCSVCGKFHIGHNK